jgi:hypothetical protein
MSRYVYVDETKRSDYVLVAVTVDDPAAARQAVRSLVLPGQRRLHMHNEQAQRRRRIVSRVQTLPIRATIYDAGRLYGTDRAARSACMEALVGDMAADGIDTELVVEQDDSLVASDRHELYRFVHRAAATDRLTYRHQRSYEDELLALPDIVAWCWVRSTEWRRRVAPVVTKARRV